MAEDERSRIKRGRGLDRPGLMICCMVLVFAEQGRADVWPETFTGVPEMVLPKYPEIGAPTFTTPVGNAGPTQAMRSVPSPPGNAGSGGGDGFVASNFSQYLGQSVGSGQCVALVQAANPNVGVTATWRPGDQVQGNTLLQPGTVIATFGPNGNYTNSLDGSAHAAIYLGQNAQGVQVHDQWSGQPDHIRTIAWRGVDSTSPAVNNGSKFYVITHGA